VTPVVPDTPYSRETNTGFHVYTIGLSEGHVFMEQSDINAYFQTAFGDKSEFASHKDRAIDGLGR
jgi:hypothetical protein